MKVGHASYGYYGDTYDFLVVGKYIYVTSSMYGFLGFAATPEAIADMLKDDVDNIDRRDIIEVVNAAISIASDEKPYEN